MRASNISIMPPELLREFTDHEKRSLIAYLMGASQVPMLATSGNVPYYFPPTQDLSNWHADGPRWTIDKGVIVAPAPAGGKSPVLINDMIIGDDFSATFRVNPGKDGRGTIIIGDAGQTDFSNAIRIEFAVGELISIGGVGTKSSPVDKAEKLKADWNKLEIFVAGKNITVKLNDSDVASATGITPPDRRVIALEVPNVPNRDVRFRPLEMRLSGQNK
jgi:hypothetical protein